MSTSVQNQTSKFKIDETVIYIAKTRSKVTKFLPYKVIGIVYGKINQYLCVDEYGFKHSFHEDTLLKTETLISALNTGELGDGKEI